MKVSGIAGVLILLSSSASYAGEWNPVANSQVYQSFTTDLVSASRSGTDPQNSFENDTDAKGGVSSRQFQWTRDFPADHGFDINCNHAFTRGTLNRSTANTGTGEAEVITIWDHQTEQLTFTLTNGTEDPLGGPPTGNDQEGDTFTNPNPTGNDPVTVEFLLSVQVAATAAKTTNPGTASASGRHSGSTTSIVAPP